MWLHLFLRLRKRQTDLNQHPHGKKGKKGGGRNDALQLRPPGQCGFKGTRNFNIRRICLEELRKHGSEELICDLFFVFCMTRQFQAGMWTHSAQCFDTYWKFPSVKHHRHRYTEGLFTGMRATIKRRIWVTSDKMRTAGLAEDFAELAFPP